MTVTGLPENIERFNKMTIGLQPHQIGEIINWVCSVVENEARTAAPVITGRLRDSIVHWMNNELSGEVGALAEYAAAVEFGYTKKSGTRVPGQKYFTPAAIHGGKLLVDELKQYTQALIEGRTVSPKTASTGASRGVGGRGGSRAVHKYLFVEETGAGKRYHYAPKKYVVTKRKFQGKPGPYKQPKSMFRRYRSGRSRSHR